MEVAGVAPHKIDLFGLQVNETVITAWCVTIGILIFSLIVRYYLVPRFKPVPTGMQLVLEFMVSMVSRFSKSVLGEYGEVIAPYMLTLAMVLVISGFTDLAGVRIPATDLNFTVSIALITFVLIFAFGIRYKGFKNTFTGYAKPVAFIAPFRVISDVIIPVSLSFRLFGNMFAGLMIMDLIYSALGAYAIGIPAALNLYFTLFDVAMQTFVFMMLTLSYIKEKVE
jgi:F-type H+-transporting ATPase subunit a